MKKIIISLLLLLSVMFVSCGDAVSESSSDVSKSPSKEESKEVSVPVSEEESLSEEEPSEEPSEESSEEKDDKSLSVLFIGNSYVYTNDMPSIFKQIGETCGYTMNVKSLTKGSHKLEGFADREDEMGSQFYDILEKEKFDYVFIQEHSTRPANNTEAFYASLEIIMPLVRSNGAEPILYETWGRKDGHETLTKFNWTHESMEELLHKAYTEMGKKYGCKVSYAGIAMLYAYRNFTKLNLFNNDGTHPSLSGSIMIAILHFANMIGVSPKELGLTEPIGTVSAAAFRQLIDAAEFAYQNGATYYDK